MSDGTVPYRSDRYFGPFWTKIPYRNTVPDGQFLTGRTGILERRYN